VSSRTFATLDPNRIGDGLALEMGNLIVKTNADQLSNARKCLGTVPRGTGDAYFECYFYSDTRPADLAETCSVGIAQVGSSLDTYVGEDADSIGLIIGTGEIQSGGSVIETVNSQAERLCIGVLVRLEAGSAGDTVAFSVNGNLLYEASIPDGQFWVPAVTVSGLDAGDMRAFLNFGQRGFDYPAIVVS
jgi:hypothetical protein